jgi:hypothetical protein
MFLHFLLPTAKAFCRVAISGSLAIQAVLFAMPYSPLSDCLDLQQGKDVAFVRQFLQTRRDDYPDVPTVYWSMGNLEDIWIALGCKSFYVAPQAAGNMFNRGTAMEGERRARLVRRFDLAMWAAFPYPLPDWKRTWVERIYRCDISSGGPTLEDLYRLCREADVDVAVLGHKFDGWYSASNGRWFIYECRSIRNALARSGPLRHGPRRDDFCDL